MLCINLTSIRENVPIVLNEKLTTQRMYVGSGDIPSFPNRLVFTANAEALTALRSKIADLTEAWLVEELDALERGPVSIVIPFALRVQEEAFTSFRARSEASVPPNALSLNLGAPRLFIHGNELALICAACERQAELKGRVCPDFVRGNFECLKSSRFALTALETFYLTEKGDLVYNATSVGTAPAEQVEDNTDTATNPAE